MKSQRFAGNPARVGEARSERNLAGFDYWDANLAAEGFTTPEAQQLAYTTLKGLFPDKLVLYPTRLDPIVWSPLSARFPAAQLNVYREFWPDLTDVAVEASEFLPGSEPLVELADLPTLQKGVCGLFAALEGPNARCRLRPTLGWR